MASGGQGFNPLQCHPGGQGFNPLLCNPGSQGFHPLLCQWAVMGSTLCFVSRRSRMPPSAMSVGGQGFNTLLCQPKVKDATLCHVSGRSWVQSSAVSCKTLFMFSIFCDRNCIIFIAPASPLNAEGQGFNPLLLLAKFCFHFQTVLRGATANSVLKALLNP